MLGFIIGGIVAVPWLIGEIDKQIAKKKREKALKRMEEQRMIVSYTRDAATRTLTKTKKVEITADETLKRADQMRDLYGRH
jgi:tellurite resistance protein